jgi:hypothetical protein
VAAGVDLACEETEEVTGVDLTGAVEEEVVAGVDLADEEPDEEEEATRRGRGGVEARRRGEAAAGVDLAGGRGREGAAPR